MSRAPRALNIFGAQGSGKGTQAKALERHFGYVHIGLGDILRKVAKENTPLGKEVNEIINIRGELVPDEMSSEIATKEIQAVPQDRGFVMEGFPRTIVQADNYRNALASTNRLTPPPAFIYLKVPIAVVKERIEKRGATEKRPDDTEKVIEHRLAVFEERTKPVLDHVTGWADVIEVNGDQPIGQVTEDILTRLTDG